MNEELTNKLLEQLRQLQAGGNQGGTLSGWQSAAPKIPTVQGVAVPVSVQTPIGKVRVYFWLGPEVAKSPEALLEAIEQLHAAGIPIDAWQESGKGWSGTSRGWSRGGWRK